MSGDDAAEIHEIIDAFAKTAALCKEAGVDGVEVHAVHEGYLLDQFTLKYTNHRTDQFGGSFENRYRFATAIVKKIKAAAEAEPGGGDHQPAEGGRADPVSGPAGAAAVLEADRGIWSATPRCAWR